MDTLTNIFASDAFSVASLTAAVAEKKIRPGRLETLEIFQVTSVPTLKIAIERIGDTIQLVAPSPRGAPGETRDYEKRTLDNLRIPHFQRDWSVLADEVQDVRKFGLLTLENVQNKVAERIAVNLADLDLTEEYCRLGAVQGVVSYKGGQTLNLFDQFGIAQPDEIDFDLRNANPVDGILRRKCTEIIRCARSAIGATAFDHLHAFVGDDFFDDLLQHREVRETYKGWNEAQILRESYIGKNRAENPILEFGGIVFENYAPPESSGDGALIGISSRKAKFFPVGMPGLFRTYYAPADYMETVNTLGKRRYAKAFQMPNGKGMHGETQMNALSICTRPAVLQSARSFTV